MVNLINQDEPSHYDEEEVTVEQLMVVIRYMNAIYKSRWVAKKQSGTHEDDFD